MTTLTSCQHAIALIPGLASGVYDLNLAGVITQAWCEFVGDVGWTLMLKVNGVAPTFTYDSSLWTNKEAYNPTAVSTGLDEIEFKSPLFWQMPFTNVRIGFLGSRTNFLPSWETFPYPGSAASLWAVFSSNSYVKITSVDRNTWKSVVGFGSLQHHCNLVGFNARGNGARVRVGTIGNNENNCESTDSFIGIGGGGWICHATTSTSAGNVAACGADQGDFVYPAWSYLMVS
eukprot:m.99466 g.99466  ORF g.99466 m.99466 type:complete len:231 (+) comp51440_c0_seq4:827-1519(+)